MNDNVVILGGDQQILNIPFNADVRGTAAGETLQITSSADVQFGAGTGDRVEFARDLSAYTFSQSGNQLVVEREDGVTARLAVNGTFKAAFQEGSADVEIGVGDSGIEVTVGGEAAGSGFDPGNVSLDPNDPSQITPPGGGSTGLPDLPANGGPSAVQTGTSGSENINANQDATISGSGGRDRFIVNQEATSVTIDDFAGDDQLFFGDGIAQGDLSVVNDTLGDGALQITAGQASVTLTNLTDAQDQIVDPTTSDIGFQGVFGESAIRTAQDDDDDENDSGSPPTDGVTASGNFFAIDEYGPTNRIDGSEDLTIAQGGNGTVNVENGASVTLETDRWNNLDIGINEGSDGNLNILGQGSEVSLANGGSIDVARAGKGTIDVRDGGHLEATYMALGGPYINENAATRDGYSVGGTGNLYIDGEGSEVSLNGTGTFSVTGRLGEEKFNTVYGAFLNVGEQGTGYLHVTDGGTLSITSQDGTFPGMNVGDSDISSGEVVVDGPGSSIEIDGGVGSPGDGGYLGWIEIGGPSTRDADTGGTGDVTVRNGGSISNDPGGATFVGRDGSTANGNLTVTGNGSNFNSGDQLIIGGGFNFSDDQPIFDRPATGSVTVENGATLSAGQAEGDGETDIFVGSNGSLQVASGATLNGDVETGAGGTFEPGNSPGLAIVQGDFTARGETTFELDGTDSGSFDRIEVAGDATLGGDVTVDVGDAFAPEVGETFAIVDADGRAGLADDLSLGIEGLPDDRQVDLSVDDGTITATIVDDPAAIA